MVITNETTRLWEVLQDIMQQRGLTSHREIGLASGVSNKLIDKVAHGHIPKSSTLLIMEKALGLQRNELLIAADYLREPAAIDPARSKLLMLIDSLSPQTRDAVIEYAQYMMLRDHWKENSPEGGRQ